MSRVLFLVIQRGAGKQANLFFAAHAGKQAHAVLFLIHAVELRAHRVHRGGVAARVQQLAEHLAVRGAARRGDLQRRAGRL